MSEPRTKVGRSLLEHMTEDASGFVAMTSGRFHIEWVLRALRQDIPLIEDEAETLDVDRLAQAMVDGLSDGGVVRIDADGWKELRDVAASIAAAYSGATRSSSGESGT